jgi:hypothetical protein
MKRLASALLPPLPRPAALYLHDEYPWGHWALMTHLQDVLRPGHAHRPAAGSAGAGLDSAGGSGPSVSQSTASAPPLLRPPRYRALFLRWFFERGDQVSASLGLGWAALERGLRKMGAAAGHPAALGEAHSATPLPPPAGTDNGGGDHGTAGGSAPAGATPGLHPHPVAAVAGLLHPFAPSAVARTLAAHHLPLRQLAALQARATGGATGPAETGNGSPAASTPSEPLTILSDAAAAAAPNAASAQLHSQCLSSVSSLLQPLHGGRVAGSRSSAPSAASAAEGAAAPLPQLASAWAPLALALHLQARHAAMPLALPSLSALVSQLLRDLPSAAASNLSSLLAAADTSDADSATAGQAAAPFFLDSPRPLHTAPLPHVLLGGAAAAEALEAAASSASDATTGARAQTVQASLQQLAATVLSTPQHPTVVNRVAALQRFADDLLQQSNLAHGGSTAAATQGRAATHTPVTDTAKPTHAAPSALSALLAALRLQPHAAAGTPPSPEGPGAALSTSLAARLPPLLAACTLVAHVRVGDVALQAVRQDYYRYLASLAAWDGGAGAAGAAEGLSDGAQQALRGQSAPASASAGDSAALQAHLALPRARLGLLDGSRPLPATSPPHPSASMQPSVAAAAPPLPLPLRLPPSAQRYSSLFSHYAPLLHASPENGAALAAAAAQSTGASAAAAGPYHPGTPLSALTCESTGAAPPSTVSSRAAPALEWRGPPLRVGATGEVATGDGDGSSASPLSLASWVTSPLATLRAALTPSNWGLGEAWVHSTPLGRAAAEWMLGVASDAPLNVWSWAPHPQYLLELGEVQCAAEGHHSLPLSLYMRLLAPQALQPDEVWARGEQGVQGGGEAAPQGEAPQGGGGTAQAPSAPSHASAEAGHSRRLQGFLPPSAHPSLSLHRLEVVQTLYTRRGYDLTLVAAAAAVTPAGGAAFSMGGAANHGSDGASEAGEAPLERTGGHSPAHCRRGLARYISARLGKLGSGGSREGSPDEPASAAHTAVPTALHERTVLGGSFLAACSLTLLFPAFGPASPWLHSHLVTEPSALSPVAPHPLLPAIAAAAGASAQAASLGEDWGALLAAPQLLLSGSTFSWLAAPGGLRWAPAAAEVSSAIAGAAAPRSFGVGMGSGMALHYPHHGFFTLTPLSAVKHQCMLPPQPSLTAPSLRASDTRAGGGSVDISTVAPEPVVASGATTAAAALPAAPSVLFHDVLQLQVAASEARRALKQGARSYLLPAEAACFVGSLIGGLTSDSGAVAADAPTALASATNLAPRSPAQSSSVSGTFLTWSQLHQFYATSPCGAAVLLRAWEPLWREPEDLANHRKAGGEMRDPESFAAPDCAAGTDCRVSGGAMLPPDPRFPPSEPYLAAQARRRSQQQRHSAGALVGEIVAGTGSSGVDVCSNSFERWEL